MTERKRKVLYWLLKIASIIISCAFPIWAICEKFPLWTASYGKYRTVGVGIILITFVVTVIFRKTVFGYIKERFNIKHAPPMTIWLVMLIISYILIYIGDVMRDMATVFWMGFIGCAIGTFLTYLSGRYAKEVKKDE